MYGVWLILVLVVTGGAIAFIGDRLGTKVGKKKLSIFGLRPRHTSIIVTIVTGILITTMTLGVMALTSENVRTALFGMEKLQENMAKTRESLTQAEKELELAQSERAETNEQLEKAKADVDKLQLQQKELQAASDELVAGNKILEEENSRLAARNDSLVSENNSLTNSNDKLTSANENLTNENGKLTSDNKELLERTIALRNGLIYLREGDVVFRAGEVIASGVVRGNRPASEVASDLQALAQVANRNVSARLGENTGDKDIWIYQPEYDAAVKTIAESPQDMVVRIVAAGNLIRGESVRTTLALYKNSVIYKNKEFIIAKPYTLYGDGQEAEETAMNFLKEVNLAANAKGILADPITGSVGVMDGEEFYDIVNKLRGMRGSVVLSAYALGDTDALGPLRLKLKVDQDETSAVK